jgi:hypothetical protein
MDKYAAVGVALVALGLGLVLVPGLAPFALDAWVVALVGVVALLQGVNRMRERRRTPIDTEKLPALERPQELPRPGEKFDAAVEGGELDAMRSYSARKRVRERLEEAAVDALMRHRDLDEAAAREALAKGTWTDDPWAAAQFAGDFPDWTPLRVRLLGWTTRSRHARRATRAADEIARIAGVGDEPTEIADPDADATEGSA